MFASLRQRFRHSQFHPGLLGLFTNPFYFARRGLRHWIVNFGSQITGRTLDIGCGRKPYERLFRSTEYIGLEIDTPRSRALGMAEYFYDGTAFPFEDEAFDSIVCNQVLEHVFNPERFLAEASRVLKPGGVLLLTVPFVWDEHEQPFDFGRYSSFGLRHILERAGLTVVEHAKSVADGTLLFQLLNAMIFKRFVGKPRWLNAFVLLFLMAPVNIAGRVFGRLIPCGSDLYLDNIVLARK